TTTRSKPHSYQFEYVKNAPPPKTGNNSEGKQMSGCLTQLFAKDITLDEKQELDEALQRELEKSVVLFKPKFLTAGEARRKTATAAAIAAKVDPVPSAPASSPSLLHFRNGVGLLSLPNRPGGRREPQALHREWHREAIRAVRRLSDEKGFAVAVMMDTEGSEIHMGDLGGAPSTKAESQKKCKQYKFVFSPSWFSKCKWKVYRGEDGVGMRGEGTVSAVGAVVWLGGLVGFSPPSDNAAHQ
ncbi:hypothetical protein ACJX0J_018049, partial [Zea mays]